MLIGFKLLPSATQELLENKMNEKVTPEGVFAEIGLKAAIAATQYHRFDPDGNRKIERTDIAKVFSQVEGVSAEQAFAIADTIMMEADTDYIHKREPVELVAQFLRKVFCGCMSLKELNEARDTKTDDMYKKRTGASKSDEGLDFEEFVTCLEGRSGLNFDKFKESLAKKLPPDMQTNLRRRGELEDIKHMMEIEGIDWQMGTAYREHNANKANARAQPLLKASGLKWRNVGKQKPENGEELFNQSLASALRKKLEFKEAEWDEFEIRYLHMKHFIKLNDDSYARPAERWKDDFPREVKLPGPQIV